MSQPNLSRRQWFRLRKPHQNKMLDESAVTDDSQPSTTNKAKGLQPVETPPNYVGMNLDELPPMREATLSDQEVKDLFTDIEQLATEIQLMQRSAGARQANAQRADDQEKLAQARQALLDGAVPRLQIRYRWQNSLWIDTLKKVPEGFHIVRINHRSS